MGTRGAFGFRIDQVDKVTYNHFDSYPDGLGEDVVKFARKVALDIAGYRQKAKDLVPVDTNVPPSLEIITKASKLGLINTSVSNQSLQDWYCVLREAQGNPERILAIGVYEEKAAFLHDSVFCEYAYLINFDTEEIEFYKGFNNDKLAEGRYAQFGGERGLTDAYYGVRLVGTAPLSAIPEDWSRLFDENEEEGEEEIA